MFSLCQKFPKLELDPLRKDACYVAAVSKTVVIATSDAEEVEKQHEIQN